jgi:biotin operon repressor
METTLIESIKLHQQLIDAIVQTADQDGISRMSQKSLGAKIGRSQAWVHKAISRLNAEDLCVLHTEEGYSVKYTDLFRNGIFHKLFLMIEEIIKDPKILNLSQSEQASKFNVSVKTVQMLKGYLLTMIDVENDGGSFLSSDL